MTNHTIPDEEVEDTDYELKLEQARNAFKQLGASCKELLSKFYFEKMSLNEIASLLDLDAASARNKKYRCMQKLRGLALVKPPKTE
jgi:RNA polymerase sigma factor (sigma-70 family)